MQLVKRLRVRSMLWEERENCKLTVGSVDQYLQNKGTHVLSKNLAGTVGISLGPDLVGRDLEYTFTHRMLIGERRPGPGPRWPTEPKEWVMYTKECYELGMTSFLLCRVERSDTWSWSAAGSYVPGAPLYYRRHHLLSLVCGYDTEFSPISSFQLDLTPEEYEECTKLLPGSVFDLTLRLVDST